MLHHRKRRKATSPADAFISNVLDLDSSICPELYSCIPIVADTAEGGEGESTPYRATATDLHNCNVPVRGRSRHLYVYSQTLDCVLQKQCIPCLYKIFPDGCNDRYLLEIISIEKSQDSSNSNCTVPSPPIRGAENYPTNKRPEMCSRSGLMPSKVGQGSLSPLVGLMSNMYGTHLTIDFQSVHEVLTVGDGDFTFSLSLSEIERFQEYIDCKDDPSSAVKRHPSSKHCKLKLTATSHESYRSICSTYPQAVDTLNRLTYLGATVLHGVDATDLQGSPSMAYIVDRSHTFDFIIWNFPCISLPAGADGQTSELEQNRDLLKRFFSNIRPFLTPDRGEVHVTHKTIVSVLS